MKKDIPSEIEIPEISTESLKKVVKSKILVKPKLVKKEIVNEIKETKK